MALYLGLDAGTQSVKAELIDSAAGLILQSCTVHFGKELSEYRSPNGFLVNENPTVRQADPLMWLDALDLVLKKLRQTGAPLDQVAGISGSGQQHGSVYLNETFETILARLKSEHSLSQQLKPALSRPVAPIWMDHSTTEECRELNEHFGERLRSVTGSPAIERFTGSQIRRFAKQEPTAYQQTAHIHLVSSFLASVLAGKSMPIDFGDGAGMNLFNLQTLTWDREIVDFTAPFLHKKLPPIVPSNRKVGKLCNYFAKYGFRPGIPIVAFSGDNPNSLIGSGASEPGTAVISLGTSDTFFAAMRDFRTDPVGCGHIFGNPAGGFMSLICFVNGSLAREKVKQECDVDWKYFDRTAAEITLPGNHGKLMLPYFEPECTPSISQAGAHYNFEPANATQAERIRAVLESQALTLRLHSGWMGESFRRIRITGGASGSQAFRQILADVFQASIESIKVVNSAALGAAMRAAEAVELGGFETLYTQFCQSTETILPNPANASLYDRMLREFAIFEKQFCSTK